jgi:hypothetical protein
MMIKVPNFYEHRTKLGSLTVAADPYFESAKSLHFFNSDLARKGFLAVNLIYFNEGDHTYDLSNVEVLLRREDGTALSPIPTKDVSRKVLRRTPLRMLAWGVAGLIVLTIPFSLSAGIDSHRANKRIRQQIRDNQLTELELRQRETVSGFYFFRLGRKSREIKRALKESYQLHVKGLEEVDTGENYEFNIALT